MSTFYLGPYDFHGQWGSPEFEQYQIEGESRPAVDGHLLYELGKRGKPFEMEFIRGVTNYHAGVALYKTYCNAGGLGPLDLIIDGTAISGFRYQVLNVRGGFERGYAKAVVCFYNKNETTLYQAIVRTVWTLLPKANPT